MFNSLKIKVIEKVIIFFLTSKDGTKMLEGLRSKLSGYKNYIVASGAIVGLFVAWVTGSIETGEMVKGMVESVIAMTLRAGIKSKE